MSVPLPGTIPDSPICRSGVDEARPCEFAVRCVESRQRIQSGYRQVDGRWVQIGETFWGELCWAYQQFRDRGVLPGIATVAPATREPGEEPF